MFLYCKRRRKKKKKRRRRVREDTTRHDTTMQVKEGMERCTCRPFVPALTATPSPAGEPTEGRLRANKVPNRPQKGAKKGARMCGEAAKGACPPERGSTAPGLLAIHRSRAAMHIMGGGQELHGWARVGDAACGEDHRCGGPLELWRARCGEGGRALQVDQFVPTLRPTPLLTLGAKAAGHTISAR